ncbi:MAG: CIA30 family protein, partial [Leptolyngbyaceae cyanobacterium RM2_2_21]|nr:CIA30 family protein [Leptolyngbyaceae cyanobacterium RM2_2_21]
MAPQSSGQWNLTQFIETLNFFGEIPLLGNIRWLQQMFDSFAIVSAASFPDPVKAGKILIVGAATFWGQSIAKILHQQGYTLTFWLESSSQQNLPEYLPGEFVTELSPEMLNGVSAIFICDTDLDSIEQWTQRFSSLASSAEVTYPLFDFRQPSAEMKMKSIWGALDDVVMGGVSSGGLTQGNGAAAFSGNVSTANSGGFSSVRTRDFDPPFDLKDWQGICLTLQGDGQRYKFILRDRQGWDSVAYCRSFDTVSQQETTVHIPFASLRPTFRAKTVNDAAPFDPSRVYSFQIMLSKFEYDRALNPHFEAGSFELKIKNIDVYASPKALNIFNLGPQPHLQSVQFDIEPAALHHVNTSETTPEAAITICSTRDVRQGLSSAW